ncbi:hypothetical protein PHBOTO_001356 [Pseudozyma hubeiensis]|nr:hypothetical protein PHBOTO_001356 [Pseudozyma hubeiensis]
MGSKHKPNLSQSSNSSSEDGTASRSSSSSHAQPSTSQSTMSRWERLRRPSAASSTKRPNFNEFSRSNSSSTVTSPTTSFFPLPSPLGGPSQDMMRTASDDSYMHILAASAAARRAAMESGGPASDAASVMSFTCSLSKEFDRQRGDERSLHASLHDLPSAMAAANKMHSEQQAQGLDKKQAWLDTTFHKLSARYRAPKKGATSKTPVRPTKPHFLDLSSIICPTPARSDRSSATTEDEAEAGDRSSSSSSSFNSGPDSSFEAMSGWDDSSADTSVELRTPQNEEDRQLSCSAYDFTTPRPSQMQRFASAQSAAAASVASGMRLPSPPLISPLMPNFALPSSGASTPGFAPPSANNYGFPIPPQMSGRGVTVDDIQHKPSSVAMHPSNTLGVPSTAPVSGMRQLRKQKSFDNPAELRRRQKQEWSVGGPKPPGFGGNAKLTIGIPQPQQFKQPSQRGMLSPQSATSPPMSMHPLDSRQRAHSRVRSPPTHEAMLPPQAPVHSRVAEMQSRAGAMQRGLSCDAAGASVQQHSAAVTSSRSPPQRPGLLPAASTGALRTLHGAMMGSTPAVSDLDAASSTGFSTSARQPRQEYARRITSPMQSPVGGAVPLPPLLPASGRESFGSSVGTESLPPTPLSATFLRGLPLAAVDERVKPPGPSRDARVPHDLQQPFAQGSALGLAPGKMVRAHSDFSHACGSDQPGQMRNHGSRLRGESTGSQDSNDMEIMSRPAYTTQTTPRQKIRPDLRREHTSNAILVSPPKDASRIDLRSGLLHESPRSASAASATITPRSSSLKDLVAAGMSESQGERASLDSDNSDSCLAYTKPSPLIQQEGHMSNNNITPTNSYRTDLGAAAGSKWSPDDSPANTVKRGGARQRANSRADEWAANLRKFTNRGGANHHPLPTTTAGVGKE